MTREEMLRSLGFTEHQWNAFLDKMNAFVESLTPEEREVFRRATPSVEQAVAAFGGKATPQDLQNLLGDRFPWFPVICCFPLFGDEG